MKAKIVEFLKQFRFVLDMGLVVWKFKHQWGNPDGYGGKLSIGLTLVKPGDEES
jgi:hypothetical protein